MARITRGKFVERFQNGSIDADRSRHNVATQQLAEAGMSRAQLSAADLNNDGKIQGTRELSALFEKVDSFDSNGSSESFDTGRHRPTQSGKVLTALDLLFTSHNEPVAGLDIHRPVGPGQANRREDVIAVQTRLKDLGFDIAVDGGFGNQTKNALQVYEAMVTGNDDPSSLSGSLQPGSNLHRVLGSDNAPKWVRMPNEAPGIKNHDRDGFSYGSEQLKDVLLDAGQSYKDNYLANNPDASSISLNDASLRNGGDNRDHATHESGLDMDLRLPTKDGGSGSEVGWRNYDRDATYAMVKALASDSRVDKVILSDSTLRRRAHNNNEPWADKVVDGGRQHRNHIHLDVKPPASALNS